ncbi:MAG: imidazole glycerol phosphate synthase subunit HisH [Hydrogenibacillus schlegelii]|uniref:Imidazole glycerol phosphate synthase subunit HisH n=1 Tax=Hydrogenibacillus schlegelii TaxID=1484 RepID=A0A2T5G8B9_HYDSH|nr:imidazole glycerol phosphate synthase subunit HisH [Hydrogenibacillus schlegelii]MBT9281662.1 imidazole glycerol phosphate synthase subunit HisH [Hydrogenibacillus schlegelii]PTQ52399.1 MAG: Imidazole glycerol phosphate synthase amidotransferase subunit [Hydrogenibacillus schlegelii]
MRIAIVDTGLGNLRSVQKALIRLGADARLTVLPEELEAADGVVLPGVGAFPAAMDHLKRHGLVESLRELAARQTPLLGICLGMQLLFEKSEEWKLTLGLGLLPGQVTRLPAEVKLPHIGWNTVMPRRSHPIWEGLEPGTWFYFVHTYAVEAQEASDVIAVTKYGRPFPSIVARGNVVGVQFHPEKSSTAGLQLLGNWLRIVKERRPPSPSA